MITKSDLSLYQVCNNCESRCCTEPGNPGVLPFELDRIREYTKSKDLSDFITQVPDKPYYTIEKTTKGCPYFYNGCQIQEVKPIDCKIYPIGIGAEDKHGISPICPAKKLINEKYKKNTIDLISKLTQEEKEQILEYGINQGWKFTQRPTEFGLELIIDLYNCDKKTISSKEKIKEYLTNAVKIIDMNAVGEPIIPEKFGKGTLYGYSAIQFIQTSSVTIHCSEVMLESHINIFSCKDFDVKKARKFTKEYFQATKIRSRKIIR